MADDLPRTAPAGVRRVLVISYFFPPLGGGGVQRTLKYVKYLVGHGWQPVVIAPRDPDYEPRDPSLAAQIPAVTEIHRTFCWEPSRVYRWLVRVTRYRPHEETAQAQKTSNGTHSVSGGGAEGALAATPTSGMGRWGALSRILFFPDLQIGWLPFALRSALRVNRERRVDVVYSTSPVITAHLIAGLFKARTGLPWVADFRDPWIGNPFVPPLPAPHRWLQARVERWIVGHADRVVFATPSICRQYRARYPAQAARFITINNGYDRTDLPPVGSTDRTPGRFRLVYAGSLYGQRGLSLFLEGVNRFLQRDPAASDRLEIEFVGLHDAKNTALARSYAAPERIGSMIRLVDFLPRAQALDRVAAANAALLLIAPDPSMDLVVTGKLFDYLGLDKQILAMVPEGDARQILRELDWGVIADPDPESVAEALARLLTAPPPTRSADPEGRYDRARLAARLAGVLDDVAGTPA